MSLPVEFKVVSIEGAPDGMLFLLPHDIAQLVLSARNMEDLGEAIAEVIKRPKECSVLKVGK